MINKATGIVAAMALFSGLDASASEYTAFCAVQGVDIYANRVSFKCDGGILPEYTTNVIYFAVSAVDTDFANRLVTLGTVATQRATSPTLLLNFSFETSTTGNVAGCDASNCRMLTRISLRNPNALNFYSPYVP